MSDAGTDTLVRAKPSPGILHRMRPGRLRALDAALFGLFVASGFCGLLYQVVWVRLAFAQFGVITPVLSVVVAVFMAGLGLGTWIGGPLARAARSRLGVSPAVVYAVAELLIGVGAFLVPQLFGAGSAWLLTQGASSSGMYLLLSALIIAGSLLPWCVLMGATFPLMMEFVREAKADGERSFSFLYVANVIGAMLGTCATAVVLVEWLGFARTWQLAAAVNLGIALASLALARGVAHAPRPAPMPSAPASAATGDGWRLVVLFTTGFCSLALEVVWTRAFTFVLHHTIYAFAMILAAYLLATWLGSVAYRMLAGSRRAPSTAALLAWLAAAALLPVVANDPGLHAQGGLTLLSILPVCGLLGYLTPKLVDEYSLGDPVRVGRCYGLNILGGILGPLVAGYLLLPRMDVRFAEVLLALPMLALALLARRREASAGPRLLAAAPALALLGVAVLVSRSYEEGAARHGPRVVFRDHVASVVAHGTGMERGLLVNGTGIARLTPITKVMAHLPLAEHGEVRSAVAICFGMGTTLRSMRSWGIEAVGIDLAGSVLAAFPFYHADAAEVLADPRIRLVADDGRRFLQRAGQRYDLIAVDPPPPPEAAGSSMLYSHEFYATVRLRLAPFGLMHQWLPTGNEQILRAALRSLLDSFPHVALFRSIEDWGIHVLASDRPLRIPTPAEFLQRLPPAAVADLMEWYPDRTPAQVAEAILSRRIEVSEVLPGALRDGPVITDDRPYNEYYVLRHRGLAR